ncbi:Peptidase A1 domain-containing protein [Mycena venus]|uniref:Peptidase A1 domain-containing protein n=1 Tax=Mycena venus TaxID=2733690 RepID=A0A8H7CSW0_9AGAR|nr:Peptidase A1 domain-containing protein [Mycena venus]
MWLFAVLFLLAAVAERPYALVVQGTRFLQSRDQQPGATLQAVALEGIDVRYTTNLTINGQSFKVLIDTGSSDLWVIPPSSFIFDNTGIPILAPFAGGNVSGTIGFGSVELGTYKVNQQVFQNATFIDVALVQSLGIDGLIGLAFESIETSPITATLQANGSNPTLGNPFLFNIFDQTPGQDNFIGISLSRTGDLEDTADASFTINELDPTYTAVANAPTIPLLSGTLNRWRIAVDSFSVDGVDVPLPSSVVSTAPAGKLATVLDTGTPTASLPSPLIDSIFSKIPGSLLTVVDGSGSPSPLWTVPCNTTSIVSVGMGGQPFPIHPLDLTEIFVNNVTNVVTCVAQWFAAPGSPDDFDMIFGDSFMRNFYSVFNFGASVSQAPTGSSVQLLSQTNPTSAKTDVINVRMAQLTEQPPTGQSSAGPSPTAGAKHGGQAGLMVSHSILFLFSILPFLLL